MGCVSTLTSESLTGGGAVLFHYIPKDKWTDKFHELSTWMTPEQCAVANKLVGADPKEASSLDEEMPLEEFMACLFQACGDVVGESIGAPRTAHGSADATAVESAPSRSLSTRKRKAPSRSNM